MLREANHILPFLPPSDDGLKDGRAGGHARGPQIVNATLL